MKKNSIDLNKGTQSLIITFGATTTERDNYDAAAKLDGRTRSNWMRHTLNRAHAAAFAEFKNQKAEKLLLTRKSE